MLLLVFRHFVRVTTVLRIALQRFNIPYACLCQTRIEIISPPSLAFRVETYILPRTKSQSNKNEKNIHVQRARG